MSKIAANFFSPPFPMQVANNLSRGKRGGRKVKASKDTPAEESTSAAEGSSKGTSSSIVRLPLLVI